jgi:hypothetical protein
MVITFIQRKCNDIIFFFKLNLCIIIDRSTINVNKLQSDSPLSRRIIGDTI